MVCQHDVIDDVAKFPQLHRAHILPDRAVHLRHTFDAVESFTQPSDEALAEPRSNEVKIAKNLHDVGFGERSHDDRKAHELASSRSSTSRQGPPRPGLAAASARRFAISATCQSGIMLASNWSGKLSHNVSINSRRSCTLNLSKPNVARSVGIVMLQERMQYYCTAARHSSHQLRNR